MYHVKRLFRGQPFSVQPHPGGQLVFGCNCGKEEEELRVGLAQAVPKEGEPIGGG